MGGDQQVLMFLRPRWASPVGAGICRWLPREVLLCYRNRKQEVPSSPSTRADPVLIGLLADSDRATKQSRSVVCRVSTPHIKRPRWEGWVWNGEAIGSLLAYLFHELTVWCLPLLEILPGLTIFLEWPTEPDVKWIPDLWTHPQLQHSSLYCALAFLLFLRHH